MLLLHTILGCLFKCFVPIALFPLPHCELTIDTWNEIDAAAQNRKRRIA